jgi:signal transduction histidine kinase
LQVLRILQEAVSNALRHAHASELYLSADRDPTSQRLCLELRDNGSGLAATASRGHGLTNMQQRAAEIGAEFAVRSDARGTTVRLLLPELHRMHAPIHGVDAPDG